MGLFWLMLIQFKHLHWWTVVWSQGWTPFWSVCYACTYLIVGQQGIIVSKEVSKLLSIWLCGVSLSVCVSVGPQLGSRLKYLMNYWMFGWHSWFIEDQFWWLWWSSAFPLAPQAGQGFHFFSETAWHPQDAVAHYFVEIHGSRTIYASDFGDPQTVRPAPLAGLHFSFWVRY